MMFWGLVGLTAIDVSLCGTFRSQSVLTFAAVVVAVVQMAVPVFVWPGELPNTALVTGAGALTALWTKSTGWTFSPASAPALATPRNGMVAVAATTIRAR